MTKSHPSQPNSDDESAREQEDVTPDVDVNRDEGIDATVSLDGTPSGAGSSEPPGPSIHPTSDAARPSRHDVAQEVPEYIGKYRVIKKLGAGGMGQVFVAEDPEVGRVVALKIPTQEGDQESPAAQRFLREAKSAAGLTHPCICPVYDFGMHGDRPFLVMAYIRGTPLSDRMSGEPRLSLYESVTLVRQLAEAIEFAHRQGVIHRDIKPQNIMLDEANRPILLDFGLARTTADTDVELTRSGAILGTPAYLSPEQADGQSRAVGPASDIYSLGVLMYELISGRRPFDGSPAEVIGKHLYVDPDKPSTHQSRVDSTLDRICLRMLAKKADDRYESAGEIAAILGQWCQNREQLSMTERDAERLGWWIPVSMIAAALYLFYFVWFFWVDAEDDPFDWIFNSICAAPCVLTGIAILGLGGWWIFRNLRMRRLRN